ncbi:hypothetical protein EXN66_Car009907 [Channa argus]|uniref:Uncharacterized protein n=1 Tax=Channa argus TaxID=215402 RepID=A0A6G1PV65_CHAAH|nr:hypothetical protein EXN66_Car009907 [Channa argus]
MLGAQRIAVYGCDDQQSLESLALTQGQPVTAERERGRVAAAVQPLSLQEGSFSFFSSSNRGQS